MQKDREKQMITTRETLQSLLLQTPLMDAKSAGESLRKKLDICLVSGLLQDISLLQKGD